MVKESLAVVGGGVAGLTAAHILQRRYTVTFFEKNSYVGGHTNTLVLEDGPDAGTPIDTGFIVLNNRNYPSFHKLLAELRTAVRPSDMSFGYWCRTTGLQYAGTDIRGLLAQPLNLLKPFFVKMILDAVRFRRDAKKDLQEERLGAVTMGRYLEKERYSTGFVRHYLVPMGAAIWSAAENDILDFPAETFLRFFDNHGLVDLTDRPQWQTVVGGSHSYVQAMLRRFKGAIRLNSPVASVRRQENGVFVKVPGHPELRFDRIVIAAHADEALALLADPSPEERRLLGAWSYAKNRTILHRDSSFLPPNRRAWASWNYTRESLSDGVHPVSVTYHMNRLQGLKTRFEYCVTLNPRRSIAAGTVIRDLEYDHPTYTLKALATQKDLPGLNGQRRTAYCGSYFGYGFHEDAVKSAVAAARTLGVDW